MTVWFLNAATSLVVDLLVTDTLRFLSIRTSIPYGKYDPIHTEMQGKSKKIEQNFIHLFVFLN